VQRLIDVLKLLRNRPRSLAASGIVLAGALLATAVLVLQQPVAREDLTAAPMFEPTFNAPRRVEATQKSMTTSQPPEITLPPEILAEVPPAASLSAVPPILGPSLGTQAPPDRFAAPGVARLVGEIIPETIEEAKHESSGPGLH
jgi:hypothetical protein